MRVFRLPDLGEGLKEAEIVAWYVAAGDEITADDRLVSVETDKAIVDVPSPWNGRIEKLFAKVGDIVQTGGPLVEFAGDEAPRAADSGTVVGEVLTGDETLLEQPSPVAPRTGAAVKATPAVRALARRLEVDLSIVSPSGPNGAVTVADVKRVANRLEKMGPLELLHGVRRTMATKMIQSGAQVVPATVIDDADIDHWPAATDTTVRLLLAVVAGCKAEPSLNAWFDGHSLGRRVLPQIDIAVAVDTPDGLFTPVLRDVGHRVYDDLYAGLTKIKADITARRVPVREMRGCTISLSNFGMIAGRYATPVIVPPTVAILGAGRIESRAVVVDGTVVPRRILPLSLSFDHRAVTGSEAGRFMAAVIASLKSISTRQ